MLQPVAKKFKTEIIDVEAWENESASSSQAKVPMPKEDYSLDVICLGKLETPLIEIEDSQEDSDEITPQRNTQRFLNPFARSQSTVAPMETVSIDDEIVVPPQR